MNFKLNHIKNNKGSVLVTVLLLFVALVGYTLYFIGSARLKADIKRRSENDTTVLAATAKIRSILSTPANCNATFSNGTNGVNGTLPAIRKCNGVNNCYAGPNGFGNGTPSVEIPVVGGAQWNPAVTGITPSNVRLVGISYTRTLAQTMDRPAKVELTLRFEKRLRDGATPVTSFQETKLEQYVVFDVPTKTTIVGCPRSPSTIDAFGDRACHKPWNYDEVILHNTGVTAYRLPQVVGCSFAGNVQTRNCSDTVLTGSFMYQSCINDGGWSASPTPTGPCTCIGGGIGSRPGTYHCNNPAPDPGGLPCPGSGATTISCTMPLATCP